MIFDMYSLKDFTLVHDHDKIQILIRFMIPTLFSF